MYKVAYRSAAKDNAPYIEYVSILGNAVFCRKHASKIKSVLESQGFIAHAIEVVAQEKEEQE